jgi:competence protein ComEC
MLVLVAVASLAILEAQLRSITYTPYKLPAEDSEVMISAHVVAEGEVIPTSQGGLRQTLDVVAENINSENATNQLTARLRLTLFTPKGGQNNASQRPSLDPDAMDPVATDGPVTLPELHYGDRLRFPARLRLPRNYHNPGAFDFVGYLAGKRIEATASVRADKVERLLGFTGNRWELFRTCAHRSIIAMIHKLWPPEQAALIAAMVIGDAAFIDRDTRADFQRSGAYHILVVSGMNVGILAFVSFWLLRRLRAGDFAASVLTMAMAILYAILTDVGAPVWRAVLMMAVYLGVRLLYRERSMLNPLGAAALTLMLLDPRTVLGASFQLTFLCVLAIAAVGVPLLERTSAPYRTGLRHLDTLEYDPVLPPRVAQFRLDLRMVFARVRRLLGYHDFFSSASEWTLLRGIGVLFGAFDLIVISALMQVSLALPMAYYFHRATSFGVPANILVVPFTELLMPAAVAAVGLGYISVWLARIPAIVSSVALAAITGTVRGLGGLRGADLRVPTPEPWVVLAACLSLAAAMLLARKRWRWTGLGIVAVVGSSLWIGWGPAHPYIRRGVLEVTSIDVGEGDSSLIVTPEGKTLLIDAGGPTGGPHLSEFDVGENVVSSYLWARGFQRLDVVALTHAHSDHMGGLSSVLKNFRPSELWLSVIPPSANLAKLLVEARGLGIRVEQHFDGDQFSFGGTDVRVLAPAREWRSSRPANNDSLVLKISYGATAALMEGDAEAASEARMVDQNPAAALLKVAHHGSKTSATPQFLTAVHPQYSVISVGIGNPFGLPKVEVLERLESSRVTTYRTDMDGKVTFFLDGRVVVALQSPAL